MASPTPPLPHSLARFLLHSLGASDPDRLIEHVRAGAVDFLFLRAPRHLALSERDQEAIAVVIEGVARKAGLAVVVDWR